MTNGKTVLESVIPAVSKSNGDYYGKDGLLYCGKCHTPKEAFFASLRKENAQKKLESMKSLIG